MIIGQLINGLMVGGLYALIAVGFTLIVGVLHKINFAHIEVFMVGGFIGLTVASHVASLPLVMVVVFLAGGIMGIITEMICFRRNDSEEAGITAALSSLALGILIVDTVHHGWGTEPISLDLANQLGSGSFVIFGVTFFPIQLLLLATSFVMVGALHLILQHTRLGRNIRAVADKAQAASLLGIDTAFVSKQVFFISSALAAVTGLLFALRVGTVSSDVGLSFALKGLAIAALGGMGNMWGAAAGGLLIGVIEAIAVNYGLGRLSDMVVWVCMIAVLLWRPSGLFGSVFHGAGERA